MRLQTAGPFCSNYVKPQDVLMGSLMFCVCFFSKQSMTIDLNKIICMKGPG